MYRAWRSFSKIWLIPGTGYASGTEWLFPVRRTSWSRLLRGRPFVLLIGSSGAWSIYIVSLSSDSCFPRTVVLLPSSTSGLVSSEDIRSTLLGRIRGWLRHRQNTKSFRGRKFHWLDLRARPQPGSILRGQGIRLAGPKIPRAGPSGEAAASVCRVWAGWKQVRLVKVERVCPSATMWELKGLEGICRLVGG